MRIFHSGLWLSCFLACLIVVSTSATSQKTASASAEEGRQLIASLKGPDLFRAYCAACHGLNAKGTGPLAAALKPKVPDLTLLSKNNRGDFPALRVRKMITGDDIVISHGSREMPIWGPIFHQVQADQDFGNVRLQNLLRYLESIQQK